MHKVEQVKIQIIEFLKITNSDDTIRVIDVFKYESGSSYQLTYYGYRNLSKYYEFFEINVECDKNIKNYSYIDKNIKGLYYIVSSKAKNGFMEIHTTDKKFVKWIKLYKNDLNRFINAKKKGLTQDKK